LSRMFETVVAAIAIGLARSRSGRIQRRAQIAALRWA
jgi:hypothetical protein